LAGAWPRMRRAFLLLLLIVQAFVPCGTTMPSADFCRTVRVDYSTLSPGSGTCSRSPAISLTAFNAQPPNLPPASLMDMDFAVTCPLVRHRRPHIRFLSIGSRLCSTLPSDPASRRRPCASLSLLLHQDVKGTFTPKLSFMHGVHRDRGRPRGPSPPTPPDKRVRIRRFDELILCRTAQRPEVQRTPRRWWFRRSSSFIAGFTRSQLAQAQPGG